MKKMLLIICVAVLASSCVVEEYYKPCKTEWAYQTFKYNVERQLQDVPSVVNLVLKCDLWLNAADQRARIAVEDKYFNTYKVRLEGAVITLKPTFFWYAKDIRIDTSAGSILTPDVSWQVEIGTGQYIVECKDINVWKYTTVKPESEDWQYKKCDMEVAAKSQTNDIIDFKINGSSSQVNGYYPTDYTITEAVEMEYSGLSIYPAADYRTLKGALQIQNVSYLDNVARSFLAEILSQDVYRITYHGVTEIYDNTHTFY